MAIPFSATDIPKHFADKTHFSTFAEYLESAIDSSIQMQIADSFWEPNPKKAFQVTVMYPDNCKEFLPMAILEIQMLFKNAGWKSVKADPATITATHILFLLS